MDGDGNFAQIQRVFSDFVDQFKLVTDDVEASETLIASAEYELDLLKQEFVRFSLPAAGRAEGASVPYTSFAQVAGR